MTKTKTKTKPEKRLTAKQLKEDIEFYLALKAMPPDQLGTLAPYLEAATVAYNKVLALEEEEARAREAAAAARKRVQECHIALCDARIADIRGISPVDDVDDGGSSSIH